MRTMKIPAGAADHPAWVVQTEAGCTEPNREELPGEDAVAQEFDVIVVGTGAGGGTLARTLAATGKRILLLERGNFLTRETENWDPGPVFVDGRYISADTWYDGDGTPFQPQVHYFVGGATKLYGAALYRLRPEDFGELTHVDGVSPAWPLTYADFEPWYTKAEWLYNVHGLHGADPTEGQWSRQYPWPPVSHEPGSSRSQIPWNQPDTIHFRLRAGSCSMRQTGRLAIASGARPATATPAWCTPRPTPTSSASAHC
jgi:choline dehydrogenase-like flavoprotein